MRFQNAAIQLFVLSIKRIANQQLRKRLCESLVLSKIDYCNTVYEPLTLIQQRRLQKIMNAAAALVLNRYCKTSDVVAMGWLP